MLLMYPPTIFHLPLYICSVPCCLWYVAGQCPEKPLQTDLPFYFLALTGHSWYLPKAVAADPHTGRLCIGLRRALILCVQSHLFHCCSGTIQMKCPPTMCLPGQPVKRSQYYPKA